MISVNPIVTNVGQDLLLRALAGETLTFTKFKAGDGTLPTGSDGKDLTDLISEKKEINISSSVRTSEKIRLSGHFSNATLESDFVFRELGVFAKIGTGTETLFAYINNGENSVVIHSDDTSIVMQQAFAFDISVGDAENVSATVDGVMYAPLEHEHDADDITSGVLSRSRGGTGVDNLFSLATALCPVESIVDSDDPDYPWTDTTGDIYGSGTEPDAYKVICFGQFPGARIRSHLEFEDASFTSGVFQPITVKIAYEPAMPFLGCYGYAVDTNDNYIPIVCGIIDNPDPQIGNMLLVAYSDTTATISKIVFDMDYVWKT